MSAGQAQHALGDDVAQDLVGAALDAGGRRAQQHGLEAAAARRRSSGSVMITGLVLQLLGEHGDVLHGRAGHQLADRVLRPRRLAAREGGDGAEAGVLQPGGAHGPGRQLRAHRRVVDRQAVGGLDAGSRGRTAPESRWTCPSRSTGARSSGWSARPSSRRHRAQPLGVGDAHVGEIDLVEARLAVGLLDRPDLDPGRLHAQEEHGQALVLGHGGVGAGDQDAVVGVVGAAGPDLLAVDDPVARAVGRPLGAGAQARQVRAAGGFGEQLAPDLLAAASGGR